MRYVINTSRDVEALSAICGREFGNGTVAKYFADRPAMYLKNHISSCWHAFRLYSDEHQRLRFVTGVFAMTDDDAAAYLARKRSEFLVQAEPICETMWPRTQRTLLVMCAIGQTPRGERKLGFARRIITHVGDFFPADLSNRKRFPILLAEQTSDWSRRLLAGFGFDRVGRSIDRHPIWRLDCSDPVHRTAIDRCVRMIRADRSRFFAAVGG